VGARLGAQDERHEWVLSVNPHDPTAFTEAIREALTLPPEERRSRMAALRRHVATHDISTWLTDVFGTIETLRHPEDRRQYHARV